MNEQMQSCKRCGAMKPLSEFRQYYGNRKGHYKHCLECERMEMRRKYLNNKKTLSPDELYELQAIQNLYAARERKGLQAPHKRSDKSSVLRIVEQQLAEMNADEDV